MKNLTIRIKETNFKSSEVFGTGLPLTGWALNTDENGAKTLIYSTGDVAYYPQGWTLTSDQIESMLITDEIPEIPKSESTNAIYGIRESTFLKAIAIVQKPELSLNLIENDKNE